MNYNMYFFNYKSKVIEVINIYLIENRQSLQKITGQDFLNFLTKKNFLKEAQTNKSVVINIHRIVRFQT